MRLFLFTATFLICLSNVDGAIPGRYFDDLPELGISKANLEKSRGEIVGIPSADQANPDSGRYTEIDRTTGRTVTYLVKEDILAGLILSYPPQAIGTGIKGRTKKNFSQFSDQFGSAEIGRTLRVDKALTHQEVSVAFWEVTASEKLALCSNATEYSIYLYNPNLIEHNELFADVSSKADLDKFGDAVRKQLADNAPIERDVLADYLSEVSNESVGRGSATSVEAGGQKATNGQGGADREEAAELSAGSTSYWMWIVIAAVLIGGVAIVCAARGQR